MRHLSDRITVSLEWARAALALIALDLALAAYHWVPAGLSAGALLPSAIPVVFVALFAASELWLRKIWRRIASGTLTMALSALLLISASDALIEYFYDRQFTFANDARSVPGGLFLLFGDIGKAIGLLTAVTVAVLVACTIALAWFLQWNLTSPFRGAKNRASNRSTGRRTPHIAALPAAILLFGVLTVDIAQSELPASSSEPREQLLTVVVRSLAPVTPLAAPAVAKRTSPAVIAGAGITATRMAGGTGSADPATGIGNRLPGLGGRDVHLFFVESYGKTVFEKPELRTALLPAVEQMGRALEKDGYSIASAFLESPVTGGNSWMAEAALLTGVYVRTQSEYDELLKTKSDSIPRMLERAGYHSILSMPGTVHGYWEEGKTFYGFDEMLFGPDFGYRGPMFSFVPVPDQFALEKTVELIRQRRGSTAAAAAATASTAATGPPLFVQYVLVSSHAPFNRIPPYVDDWGNLGDGSRYSQSDILTFDNDWFRGTQFDEGYAASLKYVFTTLTGYLTSVLDGAGLVILIGDHQPERPVRQDGASRSVPIHVLSKNRRLIDEFVAAGFVRGMVPTQAPPSPPTSTFFPMFTRIAGGRN